MSDKLNGIYNFTKFEDKTVKYRKRVERFNYVTVKAVSDIYVKAIAVIDLAKIEFFSVKNRNFIYRSFFIEPGEHTVGFFVDGIDESKRFVDFIGVNYFNLENKAGRLEIKEIDFSVREPFSEILLQNDKLALGFSPRYGGVPCFLTPLEYKVTETLERNGDAVSVHFTPTRVADAVNNANLINRYDNGRFPQQVYYGTQTPPYKAGVYFDTVWAFNPVQAGDSYGNRSPVVDWRVSDNSVRFRISPLDWAKNNNALDCYMDCEYTLIGNAVRVRNRFVDFSMFNDGFASKPVEQTVPTFNIVQGLNRFFVSSANNSVKEVKQLKFWAEEKNVSQQKFFVEREWSCWLNDEDYGVGLYTPGTGVHMAGIYSDGEDKYTLPSSEAERVNFIAGIRKFALESLKPIEYTYYIAVGSAREIACAFKAASKNRARTTDG